MSSSPVSRSLVTTLIRRLLLAGGLLTLANVVFVTAYYSSNPENLRREKVSHQIDRLAAALAVGEDGKISFQPSARLASTFTRHPDAYAFRIEDEQGNPLWQANPGLVAADRWTVANGPDVWSSEVKTDGRSVLVGSRRVVLKDQSVRVAFAATGDPSNLLLFVYFDELFVHVVVALLPFALCLMIVIVVTVRRSLRSLVDAAETARQAGPRHDFAGLPTEGLPSEVLSLVEAINDALQRLSGALEAERAFTAEAAHALRTPLAVLSARIDRLPQGPEFKAVKSDIEAMGRLVNQLLSAAQADTLVVDPQSQFNLSAMAEEVVAAMAPLAIRDGRSLALESVPGVIVRGDSDAIAHALRNLIENALRYSPLGAEVLVRVDAKGLLTVEDQGPGIPPHLRALVTKRFWRANSSDLGGTGLGLSIVERIAEAHGASLAIGDRKGGGAVMAIRLQVLPKKSRAATGARVALTASQG
jgi:two-component system OmpR family sensor kinase